MYPTLLPCSSLNQSGHRDQLYTKYVSQALRREGELKTAEQKDVVLASHKYMKTTLACATLLTGHLLDDGGRAHTTKPAPSAHNQVGRQGKEKRNQHGPLNPWQGTVAEESFPHPGNPLHQLGDQTGQKGSCRSSKECAAATDCGWQNRGRPAQLELATPMPKKYICWSARGMGTVNRVSGNKPGVRAMVGKTASLKQERVCQPHHRSPLWTHMQAGVACPQQPHPSCAHRVQLNEAEELYAPGLAHTGRWGWIWPSPQGLSNLGSWAEIWAQRC